MDRLYPADHAFWIYLWGAIAAWSGLSSYGRGTELGYLVYGLINVMLIFGGVFLRRTVFTVLGYLGVFAYLGHLSWSLFRDSMLLTLVLVPLVLLR